MLHRRSGVALSQPVLEDRVDLDRADRVAAPIAEDRGLTSAGLLIVNPPWTLATELRTILPELQKPLGQGGAGRFRLEAVKG